MQGTINFYSYSEFYSDSPTATTRFLKFFTRLVSPAYAHSSLTVEGWVFSYGLSGYTMTRPDNREIKTRIEVEVTHPEELLKWENPKAKSKTKRLISFPLSLYFKRFGNCATTVGKTIGIRATTPDKLFRELQR